MTSDNLMEFHDVFDIDRIVHEPARMAIMAVLYGVDTADFNFLLEMTQLSRGNLSIQARKLQEAGYLTIEKSFRKNYPYTEYRLTKKGRTALINYVNKIKLLSKMVND